MSANWAYRGIKNRHIVYKAPTQYRCFYCEKICSFIIIFYPQRRIHMKNTKEIIFELENEVKEKLQETLHKNDYLKVKSIHDFGTHNHN